MTASEWPLPSFKPVLYQGGSIRVPRDRLSDPARFQPYPRTHARRVAGDDLMRTIDERFDSDSQSQSSITSFSPALDPIIEEDEMALKLSDVIHPVDESSRNQRRLVRRISLTNVIVDLTFILKRQFKRLLTVKDDGPYLATVRNNSSLL